VAGVEESDRGNNGAERTRSCRHRESCDIKSKEKTHYPTGYIYWVSVDDVIVLMINGNRDVPKVRERDKL